ncbi:MAG: aldo/keto reductase [Ferruginibacter sp.]
MKYRNFGNTDLHVSEIGFGAWAIGGNTIIGGIPIGWGIADDRESVAAIRTSMDRGINFFDTADFYGLGHSEELLGKEIGKNKEMIIATKVGHKSINDTIRVDYTKDYILQACELSLKRLQRDAIDYYQLHTARISHLESEECIEAMQLLQQQGKIRYFGLSLNTFAPEPEANFLVGKGVASGFQLVFNIINQRAKLLMQKVADNNYGVIARMPLQFGLLTGKFTGDSTFTDDDHRSFRFSKEILTRSISVLEQLVWPLCQKYQVSKTGLALSYILSYNAISTVIPGIRTAEHAKDNTTGIVKLINEDIQLIEEAYFAHFSAIVDLMEQKG